MRTSCVYRTASTRRLWQHLQAVPMNRARDDPGRGPRGVVGADAVVDRNEMPICARCDDLAGAVRARRSGAFARSRSVAALSFWR